MFTSPVDEIQFEACWNLNNSFVEEQLDIVSTYVNKSHDCKHLPFGGSMSSIETQRIFFPINYLGFIVLLILFI